MAWQSLLLSKNLHPLLNRFLRLLTGSNLGAPEDKLCNQPPLGWEVPLFGDRGVDERVVVLQVCAEAEGFKGCPDCWNMLVEGHSEGEG